MSRPSILVPLVVVAALLVGGVWWVGRSARDVAPRPVSPPSVASGTGTSAPAAPSASTPAVDVLHAWDRRRARAYRSADEAALRALYVGGSRAGAADVRLLRRYERRGYRVHGMRMQVLAVQVVSHTENRWRLRVTDRLVGAVAIGHDERVELPRDRASTRVVTLRRSTGSPWRMASVVSG